MGKEKMLLKPVFADLLKRNNRIQWLNSFRPASESERYVICKIVGFERTDYINISPLGNNIYNPAGLEEIKRIAGLKDRDDRLASLEGSGFRIFKNEDGKAFAVNFHLKSIIDLERAGIKSEMFMKTDALRTKPSAPIQSAQGRQPNVLNKIERAGSSQGRSANREWEVGRRDR